MKRRNKVLHSLAAACLGVLAATSRSVASAPFDPSTLARFANSCAAEAQSGLTEGFTLLHCFEYPETTRIFNAILDQHPDCAIAYWGAAMSVWHPLWAPPSESDLARGAALLKKTEVLEMTPREAAFIDALKAFFSSTDTTTHRERAAALLNWVYTSRPRHPGVLHYLIHSYDFPGLAYLALPAAETYADAAPNSTHAQHMPSHIFTRLGLWERSLASNHDSTRSAAAYTKRAHLPGHYDEGLHSMDYMMYAMLQTARDDEAKALLATLSHIGKTDTENFKVAYTYAAAPARYALERRAWEEASELVLLRPDFDWSSFGWAESIRHFARGIGAARSGRLARAREELSVIEGLRDALPPTTLPYWREEVQVHVDAVRSWIVLAEGEPAEALRLASAAADREDAVDKHPVTPGEVLPARELYADMLLETGRYDDAVEQYRTVLRDSPNRLNALIGAADAAAGMEEAEIEAGYRETVREQTRFGNQERKGLKNVRVSN